MRVVDETTSEGDVADSPIYEGRISQHRGCSDEAPLPDPIGDAVAFLAEQFLQSPQRDIANGCDQAWIKR
ncbi:hypothetical protein GCM10011390_20780 [Aureimonas endophytica]|uniref:Uncharacterized protein n=1 Tax=Aureimonas endophytica TaxID=2027858 RepID=A0A916ZKA2_9HYPH|nr:hypothetical protein GCM10011390_20780 [Aureimonas endophytica]